jgi:biotin operon repressor
MSTTSRALAVLNLLQTHRHWPGRELAERLGVTERTVRRDVERLRDLGYRIESVAGVTGGYRLEAGNAIPPLLLDDDEAVAIAVGLRVAAQQRLVGGADTTLTALAKLEQVLPPALRRRVNALATSIRPDAGQGSPVAPTVLGEPALRLHRDRRCADPTPRRPAPALRRRAQLVPRLLGPRPRRLAHLPRRPHRRGRPHPRHVRPP